jgi:NTE family protein
MLYCLNMTKRIGLALSGGGSRAVAFHLGCLRSLHRHGLLQRVNTVSAVSGGSVIAAAYFIHKGSFKEFEAVVINLLKQGLVRPVVKSLFSFKGIEWISSEALAVTTVVIEYLANLLILITNWLIVQFSNTSFRIKCCRFQIRRKVTRTTLLELALDRLLYNGNNLTSGINGRFDLVLNATELTTGSAFRFSSMESGSWRFGRIVDNKISIAHAVAASAAYPLFLTHFRDRHLFERQDGTRRDSEVSLTDGGVYDNLGLGMLWPDREKTISLNVKDHEVLIVCSAGYGLRNDPHPRFIFSRMSQVISTTFDRAQNAAMDKLHKYRESGQLETLIFPYLGMRDERLPDRPSDLVERSEVHDYPTDFSAMDDHHIERISLRGEQLTDHLLKLYGRGILK